VHESIVPCLGTFLSSGLSFGAWVDTAFGTRCSCCHILQECPSPKNGEGHVDPSSVGICEGVHSLLPLPLLKAFCSSILFVALSRKAPPNKIVSFTFSCFTSVSSGKAPMLGLTLDQSTCLLSWVIVTCSEFYEI